MRNVPMSDVLSQIGKTSCVVKNTCSVATAKAAVKAESEPKPGALGWIADAIS
jgi:hypothetical protein